MKWGLSPLDWRSHAIDDQRDHPLGVLKAECGHLLMMITPCTRCPTACVSGVRHVAAGRPARSAGAR